MLERLTCQDFEKRLNQVFRLNFGGDTIDVKLAQCQRLNSGGRNDAGREPFSLIFLGPQKPVLPQQIYEFDFGELGRLEIFIVPIGPDRSGMIYQAVFA